MHVKEGAYSLGVMAPSLDGKTLLSGGSEPPTWKSIHAIPIPARHLLGPGVHN